MGRGPTMLLPLFAFVLTCQGAEINIIIVITLQAVSWEHGSGDNNLFFFFLKSVANM